MAEVTFSPNCFDHVDKLYVPEVTFSRHQYPTCTSDDPDPPTQIRLNFSGKRLSSIYCVADGELLHSSSTPMPDIHIKLDFRQLLDEQKAREIFGQKLESWHLLGEERRKLIQTAKSRIWGALYDSKSDSGRVLDLHLRVAIVRYGYGHRMVQADERSIESSHDEGNMVIVSSSGDHCAFARFAWMPC